MKKHILIPLLMIGFLASGSAWAAEIKAVRVEAGPSINGLLDDAVWRSAAPFTEFRMVVPRPNDAPSEKTELRILFDDHNLYVGIVCFDSEPRRIAANTMAHDSGGESRYGYGYGHGGGGASDDVVRVLIDPFQDKRTAYVFFINPRGARGEGLVGGGESSLNWDGIWDARSRILEDGWSAEFRIPFKTLQFKPGLSVWGINVERTIARKQEKIRISGTNRDSNFNNPMEASGLTGIEGIKQGLGITFRPYGLASTTSGSVAGAGYGEKLDGGFDVYKNFTPNLVGVFSYNMDFAETEVDERRINLTRFPIFFPEKRMFFLEGSEIFDFSSSISFRPFFSRTIGLSGGQQIPVRFGAKLFGKIGQTNLAFLDVQTGDYAGQSGRNFLAARVTQNIFAESKIGAIFTNGSPSGASNSLAGLDFQYSSSRFLGNKNIMVAAWGAYNWNDDDGRHYGYGFRANYPNDLWNISSTYAYYGEALNPGLGFMMRPAIQTGFVSVGLQPRPGPDFLGGLVRQFFFNVSADYYWDLDGNLETSTWTISPLSFMMESGDTFRIGVNALHDVLPFDFEVAKGIILPAGGYKFTNASIGYSGAPHRPVVLTANYNLGEFYSGTYNDITVGLTYKLDGFVNLSLSTEFVRAHLPEGRFSENVYQLKADFFLSPDLGLMNYIQFDDISNSLGWSARLRWRVSPGNDIYLVYNKNWERRWDPRSRFVPSEERGVFKITLSLRP